MNWLIVLALLFLLVILFLVRGAFLKGNRAGSTLVGISGWLAFYYALVWIGALSMAIRGIGFFFFTNDFWTVLQTLIGFAVLLFIGITLPRRQIATIWLARVVHLLAILALWAMLATVNATIDIAPMSLIAAIAVNMAWLVYLFKSRRVQATFRQEPRSFGESPETFKN
jgi:hypothetical protein